MLLHHFQHEDMPKYWDYEPFAKGKKYLTAILIVPGPNGPEGKKYRNIPDGKEADFIAFAKSKFPTATHCNFYYKRLAHQQRGEFKHQIILE
jgi:hypothetical protein